jgi:hypothetical protein
MVLGAIIGSQTGRPTELDHEPQLLGRQLHGYLATSGSAIALIAEKGDIDEMLAAVQDSGRRRRTSVPQRRTGRRPRHVASVNSASVARPLVAWP